MYYIAEIKEKGKSGILRPSHYCKEITKFDLINFWGLDDDDVEWYRLYKVIKGQKIEI